MVTLASPRQLAAVTGASSGIGFELAKQFATHGFDLVIAAEDEGIADAARQLASIGVEVFPVQVDLATREGVERFYREVQAQGRPLEAIAINAGVGVNGAFVDTDLDAELKLLELNVVSVVHLAKLAGRDMAQRGRGRILFTASIAAIMPAPFIAVYGASRAFVLSLSSSLHSELKERGVSVTALMPGPTDTNFFRRAHMEDTYAGSKGKHQNDPAEVARQGFEALMSGKERVVAESFSTKLQGAVARFLPEALKAQMHRKQAEPGSAKH